MNDPLEEAKGVLDDLELNLEKGHAIWVGNRELNPDWYQISEQNWLEKQSRCWLHGATYIEEANELERWLFDKPSLSELAKSRATELIKRWKKWLEIEDAYYEPFEDFELETPLSQETVLEYVNRMAETVEKEGKRARLQWRALKSFLSYMRNLNEESAFIEQIFPEKMDLFHGKIIRKIAPEVYPIPQETASSLLITLAKMCRFGRQNAQLTAAESLGLCWLCLTASRLRLPINFETIWATKITALQLDGEFPTLLVPTLFGDRKIRISHRVSKFLYALSRIPSKEPRETILQCPRRSLTRTLDRALKNIDPKPEYGNITYVTLLSPPHHFGNHRIQPK